MSNPTENENARLLNQVIGRVAAAHVATVDGQIGRGFVNSIAGAKAAVSKGTPDTAPTPGFDVPAWLSLEVGDYVLYREAGSDRAILGPLTRNAVDQFQSPLTASGQIIVAGADGTPTVIEPPDDPDSDYALQWDGTTHAPVWVAL